MKKLITIFIIILTSINLFAQNQKHLDTYAPLKDTLIIKSTSYVVTLSDPRNQYSNKLIILDMNLDTVYIHSGYASNGFLLEDFNGDGIKDIQLNYLTNTGGIIEVISYDHDEDAFKAVKNLNNFPNPKKIPNTECWYSFQKTGCAATNWESYLFIIRNFKAMKIALMEGKECLDLETKGIYVFKLLHEKERIKASKTSTTDPGGLVMPAVFKFRENYALDYWQRSYENFLP